MGFRLQKRLNLARGFGLNISKSGVSPSLRTKIGAIGPRGYTIRTGIPGLTWRGGKIKNLTPILAFALLYLLYTAFTYYTQQ